MTTPPEVLSRIREEARKAANEAWFEAPRHTERYVSPVDWKIGYALCYERLKLAEGEPVSDAPQDLRLPPEFQDLVQVTTAIDKLDVVFVHCKGGEGFTMPSSSLGLLHKVFDAMRDVIWATKVSRPPLPDVERLVEEWRPRPGYYVTAIESYGLIENGVTYLVEPFDRGVSMRPANKSGAVGHHQKNDCKFRPATDEEIRLYNEAIALSIPKHQPKPVQLSRDYEALYERLCNGGEALCYVNMKWPDGDILRDPCRVRRLKPFDIIISVRGYQYGGVEPFDQNGQSEKNLLLFECQRLDLEWVAVKSSIPKKEWEA